MAFGKVTKFDSEHGYITEEETKKEYSFSKDDIVGGAGEISEGSEVIFKPVESSEGFFAKEIIAADSDIDDEDDYIPADE